MEDRFEVAVGAGTMMSASGSAASVSFPHRWTPGGVTVEADFTGGHLLHLAAAGCVLNDLYREAAALGIELHGARVTTAGGFDPVTWQSTGISYSVEVSSGAGQPHRAASATTSAVRLRCHPSATDEGVPAFLQLHGALPVDSQFRAQFRAVPVLVTPVLRAKLGQVSGQGGAADPSTMAGYEFRNARNQSASLCLGALDTGPTTEHGDPVQALSCSSLALNEIWIPAQWDPMLISGIATTSPRMGPSGLPRTRHGISAPGTTT